MQCLSGGRLLLAGAGGCLLLLPLSGSLFSTVLATEILITSLFAVSFNLLFGYTGMLSFGQAASFGFVDYTSGLVLKRVTPSLFLGLVAGCAVAGMAALLIGFFCVRLTRVYFAMLTLAFAQVIFALAFKWYSFTGGDNGLIGIPVPPVVFGGWSIDLTNPTAFYYFVLLLVGLALVACKRIVDSPFGCVMRAIRENPERTEFVGINVRRYQLTVFVLSGMVAGFSGSLYALFQTQVFPDFIFWTKSAEPVLMTILGGIYYFLGPAVGAALFLILEVTVRTYTEYWPIFLGGILLLLVMVLPGGVLGFFETQWTRFQEVRHDSFGSFRRRRTGDDR
jgi:branched-chain amino acid transport system permease protein